MPPRLRPLPILACAALALALGATTAPALAASAAGTAVTATAASQRIANLAPTAPNMAEYGALVADGNVFAGARLHLDPQSSAHRAAAAEDAAMRDGTIGSDFAVVIAAKRDGPPVVC